ncbi:MAG: hypothetical protein ACFFDN_49400 [Candidatus Hodarchaeota archaeon]
MMQSSQLFEQLRSKLLKIENKDLLEKTYYEGLSIFLKSGQFESFINLFNSSIDFNLFIDIKKIPNRFNIISKLLLQCTEKVSTGYQTSALGEIIDILKFCNEYNLFEKEISEIERKELEDLKKDTLFIVNLFDLFGRVSDSLILYIYKVMPADLYTYFIERQDQASQYFSNIDNLMYFIKNVFFNQYSIYGLSVKYLSPVKKFINEFEKNYLDNKDHFRNKEEEPSDEDRELISFNATYKYRTFYDDIEEEHEHREIKKHLVSPKNILKNIGKIQEKGNYNFYNLSMVLLGGLGPQGLGFTYSTPKGEVVEICSDIKQNKAIIIKFKKFLKTQFIEKLRKEMKNLHIKTITIKKIAKYLTEVLDKKDLISFFEKQSILSNIKNFLLEENGDINFSDDNFKKLINKISNAINAILRPIKMMDQYKARMFLVASGLLKSEDIAKLTSLKEKSHYDILRERIFFQYITNWFYELYLTEKKNKSTKYS